MAIHRHFEDQLQELKGRLVTMGTAAESMIERAVKSLLERDATRLPEVFKTEEDVNQLHMEVDERVINGWRSCAPRSPASWSASATRP